MLVQWEGMIARVTSLSRQTRRESRAQQAETGSWHQEIIQGDRGKCRQPRYREAGRVLEKNAEMLFR